MSKRILVIDDDKSVRELFISAFDGTEYQVDVAGSDEVGMEMEQKDDYDLIFVDLEKPDKNGANVLRALRKKDGERPIYIITDYNKEFLAHLKTLRSEGLYFELLRNPRNKEEIIEITNSVLK